MVSAKVGTLLIEENYLLFIYLDIISFRPERHLNTTYNKFVFKIPKWHSTWTSAALNTEISTHFSPDEDKGTLIYGFVQLGLRRRCIPLRTVTSWDNECVSARWLSAQLTYFKVKVERKSVSHQKCTGVKIISIVTSGVCGCLGFNEPLSNGMSSLSHQLLTVCRIHY